MEAPPIAKSTISNMLETGQINSGYELWNPTREYDGSLPSSADLRPSSSSSSSCGRSGMRSPIFAAGSILPLPKGNSMVRGFSDGSSNSSGSTPSTEGQSSRAGKSSPASSATTPPEDFYAASRLVNNLLPAVVQDGNTLPVHAFGPDPAPAIDPPRFVGQLYDSNNLPSESLMSIAVDNFFDCTGVLFYLFSRAEGQELIQKVYSPRPRYDPGTLAELFALAAVGGTYDCNNFPVDIRQRLFESAKVHFDELCEADELRAMRVMVLSSLFQVLEKRMSSWHYINSAIGIARARGLHLALPGDEEWFGYRKVWRTAVFLQSWLCSTLGRRPTFPLPPFTDQLGDLLFIETNGPEAINNRIQTEMCKLSILGAEVLGEIEAAEDVLPSLVDEFVKKTEKWRDELPEFMTLRRVVQQGVENVPKARRRSLYLVHIQYLSTIILCTRRILLHVACRKTGAPWTLDCTPEKAHSFAQMCITSAKQTASLYRLMLADGSIFRRCWLAIYNAFTGANLLLFHAAQKRRYGQSKTAYSPDLQDATALVQVLTFCSQADQIASTYLGVLKPFKEALGMDPGIIPEVRKGEVDKEWPIPEIQKVPEVIAKKFCLPDTVAKDLVSRCKQKEDFKKDYGRIPVRFEGKRAAQDGVRKQAPKKPKFSKKELESLFQRVF